MNTNKNYFNSGEAYVDFVRKFVTLIDSEMNNAELLIQKDSEIGTLVDRMPALISLVNTVGYLRGQDGVFLDIRPRTENQNEFYQYEHDFEQRLENLIMRIRESNMFDYYKDRLEQYFVNSRSK